MTTINNNELDMNKLTKALGIKYCLELIFMPRF